MNEPFEIEVEPNRRWPRVGVTHIQMYSECVPCLSPYENDELLYY